MNLQALRHEQITIATGVITRALAVQGRIEAGIRELEKWANEEGKR